MSDRAEDNPWKAVPGLSIGPDNALNGDTARPTREPHTTLRTQFAEVSGAPPSPASYAARRPWPRHTSWQPPRSRAVQDGKI